MEIKPRDDVTFRFIPGTEYYPGTIVSVDETSLVLRTYVKLPKNMAAGWYLLIPEAPFSDVEIYAEIQDIHEDRLYLKRIWMGRRAYLRVEDVLPVSAHRVTGDAQFRTPRIIAPREGGTPRWQDSDGEAGDPVWEMLDHINANLEFVMEKICLESRRGSSDAGVHVNISASGIKMIVEEIVETGDIMEIKMLLPVYPPMIFVVNGDVVWTSNIGRGRRAVALRFMSMGDDMTDRLLQYTFQRQREINRTQRDDTN